MTPEELRAKYKAETGNDVVGSTPDFYPHFNTKYVSWLETIVLETLKVYRPILSSHTDHNEEIRKWSPLKGTQITQPILSSQKDLSENQK